MHGRGTKRRRVRPEVCQYGADMGQAAHTKVISALCDGAAKRARTSARLNATPRCIVDFQCIRGCHLCRQAPIDPVANYLKYGLTEGTATRAKGDQQPKKRRRKTPPPRSPQSLLSMCMRTVLQYRGWPSDFESALSSIVSTQVWRHTPMSVLKALRMMRSYDSMRWIRKGRQQKDPYFRVAHTHACSCPTEIWLSGERPVMVRITMCPPCLGFSADLLRLLAPCPACDQTFGMCGCFRQIHATIEACYSAHSGHLVRLALSMNRRGCGALGTACTVAEGYLHGKVSWDGHVQFKLPPSVKALVPKDRYFHCGIPYREAMDGMGEAYGMVTRECKIELAGGQSQPPDTFQFVTESAMPTLKAMSRMYGNNKTGDTVLRCVSAHLRGSASVRLFTSAATTYMHNALAERERSNFRHTPVPESEDYLPTYMACWKSDWPTLTKPQEDGL